MSGRSASDLIISGISKNIEAIHPRNPPPPHRDLIRGPPAIFLRQKTKISLCFWRQSGQILPARTTRGERFEKQSTESKAPVAAGASASIGRVVRSREIEREGGEAFHNDSICHARRPPISGLWTWSAAAAAAATRPAAKERAGYTPSSSCLRVAGGWGRRSSRPSSTRSPVAADTHRWGCSLRLGPCVTPSARACELRYEPLSIHHLLGQQRRVVVVLRCRRAQRAAFASFGDVAIPLVWVSFFVMAERRALFVGLESRAAPSSLTYRVQNARSFLAA